MPFIAIIVSQKSARSQIDRDNIQERTLLWITKKDNAAIESSS